MLHGDARGHITDENLLQHCMHAHDYHSESTVQQHVTNPNTGSLKKSQTKSQHTPIKRTLTGPPIIHACAMHPLTNFEQHKNS